MKKKFVLYPVLGVFLCSLLVNAFGQQEAGEVAENIVDPRLYYHTNTSKEFHLYDYPGKVLLLEFFFATCPFCIGAAPRLENDIVNYYRNRGGNADGLPVQMINFDVNYTVPTATTTAFMNQYHLEVVVRDWYQLHFSQFGGAATPHFVVINSVSNSPSHETWEIVGIDANGFPAPSDPQYSSQATARINALRALIDSVKGPVLPPELSVPEMLGNNQFRFVLRGQLGRTNRIEATRDWNSWTFISNVVNSTGSAIITDPGASPADRFYRAVVQ